MANLFFIIIISLVVIWLVINFEGILSNIIAFIAICEIYSQVLRRLDMGLEVKETIHLIRSRAKMDTQVAWAYRLLLSWIEKALEERRGAV